MSAAPPPVLDRRDDDQILAQLLRLAARHVPEWKGNPNNNPDAGTMLLRIFTRMMEITLERLNKVPEMNLYAFLNATGVNLLPPVPARVALTFALTSDSAAVLVPQGTRAATTPKGDLQPVDFETVADLTVVPAALTAAWTMDPGWDRYADRSALIDGSGGIGFTPLLGSSRLSHTLFLGDQRLLDFKRAKVTVTFGQVGQEMAGPLGEIVWQHVSGGQIEVGKRAVGANKVTIESVNAIDQTVLEGPSESSSLRRGLRSRWLQAKLRRPLAEDRRPESLTFRNLRLEVSSENLLPDLAFSNTVPIDVTMPFHPFGETPKVGDAFYLSCPEALAKPNVKFTVTFTPDIRVTKAKPPESLKLTWEFLGINNWDPFTPSIESSGTGPDSDGRPTSLSVTLQPASAIGKVNGKEGRWIRVRIAKGDYGRPAEYAPVEPGDLSKGYTLKEGTGNLAPPLVTKLTLSYEAHGTPDSIITQNGFLLTDQADANANGFNPFVGIERLTPQKYADTAPSFYLGFDKAFPNEPITLFFVVEPRSLAGGSNIVRATTASTASLPPSMRWEYFNGATWVELSVLDQTDHFTQSGTVDILTPADIAPLVRFDLKEIYWIRAILAPEGQAITNDHPFGDDPLATPRLSAVFLNTVPAVQAVTVSNEILGSGNNLPGQTFRLAQSPILADPQILVREPELPSAVERDELLRDEDSDAIQQRSNPATGETEIWIRWHEVSSFNGSAPHSRHYTLDHGTGEVVFGDGVRGLVPSLGTNNIVASYRVGAGSAGNVPKGAVAQLKSPVAGIASVVNPLSADGGADIETAEIVQERGPQTLRNRERALSRTDFEWLAREAAGTRLARVVCLPNTNRSFLFEPGWVTLVIVPQGTERRLVPSVELIRHVEESVSNRAFAGLSTLNRVNVTGPGYVEVSVAADVVLDDLRQASQVKRQVTEALDTFLHPLTGGPGGEGWVLGRNVFASEIASVIQAVPGVDYLKSLQLIPNQAQHRIEFTLPLLCPRVLPEGSCIVSADGRKSMVLAQAVPAGTEVAFLDVKGFKAGDRIVRSPGSERDDGIFNPPFIVTSVSVDRETFPTKLTLGIEPHDFESPKIEMRLATPDDRIRLPILAAGPESILPSSRFLTLEDFCPAERVQILLPDQNQALDLPLPTIKGVFPAPDAYLGGISLVCSGRHRITVSAPR